MKNESTNFRDCRNTKDKPNNNKDSHVRQSIINGNETINQINVKELNQRYITEKEIISVGFKLTRIVKQMNESFAGMIMNTYFTCLVLTIATLYSSSTILFNRNHTELLFFSAGAFSVANLSFARLVGITNCGHSLAVSMKKCVYHLDRFRSKNKECQLEEIQLLKEDLRCYSEAPITPCSAFSLSMSTLLGAYGTIITYLIVLLQFKVSEPHSSDNANATVPTTVSYSPTTSSSNISQN